MFPSPRQHGQKRAKCVLFYALSLRSAYFLTHLRVTPRTAFAHVQHRVASVIVHIDLPALAGGHAKVIGVTTGNRRAGHIVVRVCRRHIYKVRTE